MTYNMNEEEYKIHITSIINRLIKGKLIYPEIKKSKNSNKMEITILIYPTEWYHELDDDTKYNVEYNLKKLYTPLVIETMQEYINPLQEDNVENLKHVSKRLKVD